MNPEDILWRVMDRLEENKLIIEESLQGLHPKHDKDLIDSLSEVEQLTHTQLNICRRAQRRLSRK